MSNATRCCEINNNTLPFVSNNRIGDKYMGIVVLSAFFCIFSRGILNVIDRSIFRKSENDFFRGLVLNAVFPFFVSLGIMFLVWEKNYFIDYVFMPGVILSAVGAQMAAYIFTYSLSQLPVKSVVAASKVADLLIPLLVFFLTSQFKPAEYMFSTLSVALFVPFFFAMARGKLSCNYALSSLILVILLFQAGVNSFFSMNKLANTWPKFVALMACILMWRTVILTVPYLLHLYKNRSPLSRPTLRTPYGYLILRSCLAFLSQAAFFFSITRYNGSLAWPILNSTPLAACFTAHVLLHEKTGKTELAILAGCIALTIVYLTLAGTLT